MKLILARCSLLLISTLLCVIHADALTAPVSSGSDPGTPSFAGSDITSHSVGGDFASAQSAGLSNWYMPWGRLPIGNRFVSHPNDGIVRAFADQGDTTPSHPIGIPPQQATNEVLQGRPVRLAAPGPEVARARKQPRLFRSPQQPERHVKVQGGLQVLEGVPLGRLPRHNPEPSTSQGNRRAASPSHDLQLQHDVQAQNNMGPLGELFTGSMPRRLGIEQRDKQSQILEPSLQNQPELPNRTPMETPPQAQARMLFGAPSQMQNGYHAQTKAQAHVHSQPLISGHDTGSTSGVMRALNFIPEHSSLSNQAAAASVGGPDLSHREALTLVQHQALAQARAQLRAPHHAHVNPEAQWQSSTALVPPQLTQSQEKAPTPQSRIDSELEHWRMWSHGQVFSDNSWVPPFKPTELQEKLADFKLTGLLKPRHEGMAKFYNVLHPRRSAQALVRYAGDPDLARKISLVPLSKSLLLSDRELWSKLDLRILFAQSPVVAYGVVDGQLLKSAFPSMTPEDKAKLADGHVAVIQIEKPGARGYSYRLFSVLNQAPFRHIFE